MAMPNFHGVGDESGLFCKPTPPHLRAGRLGILVAVAVYRRYVEQREANRYGKLGLNKRRRGDYSVYAEGKVYSITAQGRFG